jgi:transcription-repair coupling factor (superfamily II helicase)
MRTEPLSQTVGALPSDHTLAFLANDASVRALADALQRGKQAVAIGASGSSTNLLAGVLSEIASRPVVYVVAHLDDADDALDELNDLLPRADGKARAMRFPALEVAAGARDGQVSVDLFAERLAIVRALSEGRFGAGQVLVAPIAALMQSAPTPAMLPSLALTLKRGGTMALARVLAWLESTGYERVDAVEEPGQFALRGGILDVFPPASTVANAQGEEAGMAPVRIDFFGDEIDAINEVDLATLGADRRLDRVDLVGANPDQLLTDHGSDSVLTLLPEGMIAVLGETLEIVEQARGYFERATDAKGIFGPPATLKLIKERSSALVEVNQFSAGSNEAAVRIELPVRPLPMFAQDAGEAVAELGAMSRERRVLALCQNDAERQRLSELAKEFAPDASFEERVGFLQRGFLFGDEGERGVALVPHAELFHRFHARRRVRRLSASGAAGRAMDAFLDLKPGDYVVHADHGVAKFVGLKQIKPKAPPAIPGKKAEAPPPEEYLTLEFANRVKIHVPATQIEQVQKYVGGHGGAPPLSTIGGTRWKHQKEKANEAVRDLAAEMLRVQAARESMPGIRFPNDTTWQNEFEAEFPYDETEDQIIALTQIKKDMTAERPMDRLLCGDVGYGKTELAIRAAFKAAEYGKQVAVLVPTTVLAEQHGRTFSERFADYPFKVEVLSRLRGTKEQNAALAALRKGQVDIIIGTHRLLSKDVRFADLGLVVIDEEQRFGVEHKQRLLSLRMTVDVLTLSATPIPRTLHMALLGIRDISSLTTPPVDRRAVVTEVIPYNEKRLKQVIARELNREGQVFFVHNRVHNIQRVADDVQKMAPGARIVVGHGQMPPHELEEVMMKFITRQADILVSTTIIESGIDIATANTMIINDADRFGLAELHQLRGRVGRSKHRGYCYLLLPSDRPTTDKAAKRLRAIEEYSMLGAGFKIAMRDLEIRGAGNILGPEQSGHIAAVGYDMYCRLLEVAVKELKNEPTRDPAEVTVEIGITGAFPKSYIASDTRRMEAYRRVARARTIEELARVETDLKDAYGEPPQIAQRLIELAQVRIGAFEHGALSVALVEKDVVFRTLDPDALVKSLEGAKGTVRVVRPILPDAPVRGNDLDTKRGIPSKGASPSSGPRIVEVFYRPPENFLQGTTLLTVLRRRLNPAIGATAKS